MEISWDLTGIVIDGISTAIPFGSVIFAAMNLRSVGDFS
jgi:hypothetical protein